MLAFLGVAYETNGAHKAPEYLKISPFGLVPAINDGGDALTDSNAILIYLVQTYAKGSHWLPTDPKEAAELRRWLTIAACRLPVRLWHVPHCRRSKGPMT